MRIRWCSITVALLAACGTCEPDGATTITPDPLLESESATELEVGQPTAPNIEAQATPEPSTEAGQAALERLIDPDGHARIRASAVHGSRTYAIVQRDLVAAGRAEFNAVPNHERIADAYDDVTGGCLGQDRGAVRCLAEMAPNVMLFLENIADHGSSWTVVVLENGRVHAHRSLVALSVHPPDVSFPAALRVEDVDGDARVEVMVEVPVKPVRDDILFRWGDQESGSVSYVLDETLSVQARWTSGWSMMEGMDDGDSPPRSENCSVLEEFREDHTLALEYECVEGNVQSVVCQYDAGRDRYDCPADFANQLFVNEHGRYVGETDDELRRGLRIGTGFGPIPSTDQANDDANDTSETNIVAGRIESNDRALAPGDPSMAASCTHVVRDPDPPLHVREQPNSRSPVAGDLPNGTEITLLERRGGWARITAPSAGWVWTENLQPCSGVR